MDVKSLPWVAQMMQDLGLQDNGGGFWSADDGRAIYLGQGSAQIISRVEGYGDYTTGHRYPTFPDAPWLFDAIEEHQRELMFQAAKSDGLLN